MKSVKNLVGVVVLYLMSFAGLSQTASAATAEFADRQIIVSVRMGAAALYKIYEFRLIQAYAPGYVFFVDQTTIREMNDVGQEVAVYSPAELMVTIPSVYVADTDSVIYNVRLELVDTTTLELHLVDFDTVPPTP